MRMKWFLILIVFLLHIPAAIAQEQRTRNPFLDAPEREWGVPVDGDNEVKIFNRKSVVNGAKYKDCKGVVKINTTLNSIIRLLEDPAAGTAWIYQCVEGKKVSEDDVNERIKKERIKQLTDKESIKHFKTDGFWSYDYDSVVRNTRIPDVARKVVTISIDSEYDLIPEEPGYTRIMRVYGKWELRLDSRNWAEVIYELYSEPQTGMPSGRVESGMYKNMLNTLKGMKEVLECRREEINCQRYNEGTKYVNEEDYLP